MIRKIDRYYPSHIPQVFPVFFSVLDICVAAMNSWRQFFEQFELINLDFYPHSHKKRTVLELDPSSNTTNNKWGSSFARAKSLNAYDE